ncbi:TatD family hydrolase [Rheinheimera sp. WS51]|uniref:TatD family hydrolase n=1 Tax=Rheinheimera sp. WS51 TaxID=3425886 RepID=UPI003D8D18E1
MSITASTAKKASNLYNLFDTHCHLNLPELAGTEPNQKQLQQHWQDAQQVGVTQLLIPATEPAAWPTLLKLQQQQAACWHIALGVHPWWAKTSPLAAIEQLSALYQSHSKQIVAVGEIGLDFALASDTFLAQQAWFEQQLALAKQLAKPVILHHRKSQPQLLEEIKRQHFTAGGILHAFSGSVQQAQSFIEQGFKLGIGGTITYQRAAKTHKVVQQLPLSSFVLETDAPSMPLAGYQGQINTPARLAEVFACFCQLRSEPAAEIAHALWQNSIDILGLGRL